MSWLIRIFQSVRHPTLILDLQYLILDANRAAVEATATRTEDLRGKRCYQVFHDKNRPPMGCSDILRLTESQYGFMGEAGESHVNLARNVQTLIANISPSEYYCSPR